MPRLFECEIIVALACVCCSSVSADELDDVVAKQMAQKQIPGVSLAIISDGKMVRASAYGFADVSHKLPVTTETLFQAGSISKAVSAVGVLRLVEQQKLSIDEDVNKRLQSWKLPENEFTRDEKVTVRRLLCHGAGLTVHGFPGYSTKAPIPTLVEVLDGAAPANTRAIRVDMKPGSKWRYSGGGYTVLQQLIIDVTGKPFPLFMDETVLRPIDMKHSTFEQPLQGSQAQTAATAYLPDGKAVEGQWHVYPEMAAAGLWTTASDLARFAIAIQRSYAGEAKAILSKATVREMLTRQMGDFGLGVMLLGEEGQQVLMGKKRALIFCHAGRDAGFDANLAATASTGKAAVVLINKNETSEVAIGEIMKAIAKKYDWP